MPANIAEGTGRTGDAALARFLKIAMGSATELDYHLLLARDLGLLHASRYEHLIAETRGVGKMLRTFIARLRQPTISPPANTGQQPVASSQ